MNSPKPNFAESLPPDVIRSKFDWNELKRV